MSRPIRPSELAAVLGRATDRLDLLGSELPQLVAALRDFSAGIRSGGGPGARNAVSDPTGNAALATDEWALARRHLERHIRAIDAAAAACDAIRRQALTPPPPATPAARGIPKCANPHGCPDDAWADTAGRCATCYEYLRRNDRDRRLSGQPSSRQRHSGEDQ